MQNISASEGTELEYEASFPQESLPSENMSKAVINSQLSETEDTQYDEPHEPTASDDDSDSDDTKTSSRHRDRFRTERKSTMKPTSTHSNNAEKRSSIPDTLGETHEYLLQSWNPGRFHLSWILWLA